ncbi:MAG: ABC transporter permease, partial [Candidatus Thorarchaeota archaeon]
NPRVSKDVRHAGYLDSLGLSFRVASRATARRARGTKRVILSLFLSVTLASLMWAGSAVVETTTDAYILRSAGSNVVLVGHHDVLSRYASSLSLTGTPVDENFTFIQSDYMVPADLLTALAVQDGVLQLEPRLIESETAYELPEVVWDPQLEDHRLIGDHRNATLLVVGIDWDLTVSDWYYYGSMAMSSRDVMIGGEAARRMFEDPLLQDVRIRGVTFSVTGVAFDVCNGGMLALMSLDEMRTLWSTDGTNLLLVRLRSLSTEVLASLGELASSYGFETLVQDSVVQSNIQTVSAIWFLVKPLVVVALLGAVLSLANYLLVSFSSRIRDYVIMRSIGASPRFITKTIAAEGLDICLRGGIPGVVLALIVSVYFLVPEAAVPHILFIPTFFVAMLATLVAVVLISCIPVHMILNQRSDLHVSEFAV